MPRQTNKAAQRQLGRRLQDLRRGRGMSQPEVAEQIGSTVETVSRAERGAIAPTIWTLVEFANLYEVSIDDLLGRAPPRPKDLTPQAEAAAHLVTRMGPEEASTLVAYLRAATSRVRFARTRKKKRSVQEPPGSA